MPAQPRKTFKGGVPGTKDPRSHSGSNTKEEWSLEAASGVHQPAFQAGGGVLWELAALPLPAAFAALPPADASRSSAELAVWSGTAGLPQKVASNLLVRLVAFIAQLVPNERNLVHTNKLQLKGVW